MLRNVLAAVGIAALAATAPTAHAHRGGGFDPGISIAIGDTYRDGFQFVYQLGARRPVVYADYAPAPVVVVPPVRRVVHVVHHDDYRGHRHHRHGRWREEWRERDDRGEWRSERRWRGRHDD